MKYKLIKPYPNSPKLGCKVRLDSNYYCYGSYRFSKEVIENNPEFWEKVEELPVGTKIKDTNPETEGYTYEKLENGEWKIGSQNYFTISEESIGEGKRFQIIEKLLTKEEIMQECIKRFPKGSKVKCALHGDTYTIAQKFVEPKKDDWLEGVYYYGIGCNILAIIEGESEGFYLYYKGKFAELVEEPKQMLFRTEDSFDVHYDDVVYGVYLPTSSISTYCWESKAKAFGNTSLSKDVKYFFKKENAEEYVLNNCLKLSVNEVLTILKKYNYTGSNLVNDLKNVVKSKI